MNRRIVIVVAFGVLAVELVASVWQPVPIYVLSGASVVLLLISGLVAAWRRNHRPPPTLLVDERDRSFRTPILANGLLMGLAGLQVVTLLLAVSRDGWWIGLVGVLVLGSLVVGTWRSSWYGHGLTLRPDGIEAGKMAGSLRIPWAALAAGQPGRGDNWWEVKLAYARPELVTSTGWTTARDVVVFEGAHPTFVAKAIATYAAEPSRRQAIGTVAELERLQAALPATLGTAWPQEQPAPTAATVRRVVLGCALLAGSGVVSFAPGWWSVLHVPLVLIAAGQLRAAVSGWRAARRSARPSADADHDRGAGPADRDAPVRTG